MAFIISRFQEGISLNPKEYVLDDNDELITFPTYEDAKQFLLDNSVPEDAIDNGIYIEEE